MFHAETRFELEHIYNWGNFETTIVNGLTKNAESFTSDVKTGSRVVNKSIEKTLKYLQRGAKK